MASRKDIIENENTIERELSIVYDALASTINGVIITDLGGVIEYVNPSFLRMFDYSTKNDVIGMNAEELFVKGEIKNFSDVESLINKQNGKFEEFLVNREDGSEFYVEVSSSTVTDKQDRIAGRMASFVDITERKLAERENRRLSSILLKSQELERQRLARDLHDSIAQTIHAAKINFIAYQRDPELFRDRFKKGIEIIDKASQELREVCNDLYPSILRDHGLESTIRWYIKNYLNINNIQTNLDIDLNEKNLSLDVKTNLYRIIKEIFSNILKHSFAENVSIRLYSDNGRIFLSVHDNGIGFNTDNVRSGNKGYGLTNIQHRVNDLGGTLILNSSEDSGTEILIESKYEEE